jgi:hypothetical protein
MRFKKLKLIMAAVTIRHHLKYSKKKFVIICEVLKVMNKKSAAAM